MIRLSTTLSLLVVGCVTQVPQTRSQPAADAPLNASSLAPPEGIAMGSLALHDYGGCAVASDQRVYCWTSRISPVPSFALPPGKGTIAKLAADRGGRYAWLLSTEGELFRAAIQNVSGNGVERMDPPDAVDIAVSDDHACVVTLGGRVRCWGKNDHAQVGDGTRQPRKDPVDIGMENAIRVWVNRTSSCALDRQGRVFCWGDNPVEGDPRRERPSRVEGLAPAVRLGQGMRPCVVHSDGTASCWTAPPHLPTDFSKPEKVSGISDAVAISSGDDFSCVVRRGGAVSCRGANEDGQLGVGSYGLGGLRDGVVGVADATEAASHHRATYVRTRKGEVFFWGGGINLARDPQAPRFVPTPKQVPGCNAVAQVACGMWHTCARDKRGEVSCWGDAGVLIAAQTGQTPESLRISRHGSSAIVDWIAKPMRMPVTGAVDVVSSGTQACVRQGSGRMQCWGRYHLPTPYRAAREAVREFPLARAIALGNDNGCAIGVDGNLTCFGEEARWTSYATSCPPLKRTMGPWDPNLPMPRLRQIALSHAHGCGLLSDGSIRCFGAHDAEGLGMAPMKVKPQCDRPPRVVDVPLGKETFAKVVVGSRHSCALDEQHRVWCWGANDRGQLGRGKVSGNESPALVPDLALIVHVVAGRHHACAIRAGGVVQCWGANEWGQVGDGTHGMRVDSGLEPEAPKEGTSKKTQADRNRPTEVIGLPTVIGVAAGYAHTCAWTALGQVYCWGSNERGQVGTGGRDARWRAHPVRLTGIP